jgi:hypothetical protein
MHGPINIKLQLMTTPCHWSVCVLSNIEPPDIFIKLVNRIMPLDVTLTWYLSTHLDSQCQHGGHTNVQGRSDINNNYPGVLKLYIVMYLHIYICSFP